MEAETWGAEQHTLRVPASRRTSLGLWFANGLILAGVVLLLGAAVYAAYTLLSGWLMEQERYVLNRDIAPLSILDVSTPPANPAVEPSEVSPLQPSADTSATQPSLPVQIRIPALGVKRSIIELPLTRNPRTGAWTRELDTLLRFRQRDVVGHWGGSANPGEEGNTILVGHNYGYGFRAVFVRLGRLKAGQEIQVVNEEGETFTYEVKSVDQVKWRRKDLEEAWRHSTFLAPGGPERLTLVTCGGASVEPFPERIYVVAEPVR
jgi:LPXTG-site transpeptidase (sortase) family protein